MKVYISIPISGFNPNKVREHADLVKAMLSRQGHKPVSPFDIYCGEKPSYEDYITCDLRAMMDCDAIFFCKGWKQSCGCGIEYDTAMRLKAYGRKNFKIMFE